MTFREDQLALLVDNSSRRYLITLKSGTYFHCHHGRVEHDSIIGRDPGSVVISEMGRKLTVLRPTYVDYILKMPRGAQVIYPKDAAMITMFGDIFPGATVLESGTGSGALTMALLRAVGAKGRVISFDVREDFQSIARRNIERFCPNEFPALDLRLGDVTESAPDVLCDRMVLDLPEPWEVLKIGEQWLKPDGIITAYMPTVTQVVRLVDALNLGGCWSSIQTSETLRRTWKVEGMAVRPDHRMVAHTAFITTARLMVR